MVCAFFARSWFQLFLQDAGYELRLASDLSFFLLLPVVAVLMWPIIRANVVPMRRWFRPPESWWRLIAYSVLFGILLRLIYWAYHTAGAAFGWLFRESSAVIPIPQFYFSCPEAPVLVLSILVSVILTPIFEELIHRGYILHALLPRGNLPAILLSAVFFGVMHRPGSIVVAFLVGLPLAILAINLRALWGPIIIHATYNFAVIFDWSCLHPNWNPAETSPQLLVVGGVSAVILSGCLAVLYRLLRYARTGTHLTSRS